MADREDARVVVITGAGSGFGRAAAERFAARGWRVFATVRRADSGDALRETAAARGWRLTAPLLDVTSDSSVSAAIAGVLADTGGRVDALVNNAGYYAFGPLEETTPDELTAQLATNVVGVHRVTRAVLPAMRARGAGAVVVVGSVSGRVAVPIVGPYHASKWALEGMVEAWRLELIPFGVRVALIEPGPFQTQLYDSERLAAASGGANSPYAELVASYRRQLARVPRSGNLARVVDVIERAATARNPRLRWLVGPTSFSVGRLRRWVPDRLYEWILRLGFPIPSPRARARRQRRRDPL